MKFLVSPDCYDRDFTHLVLTACSRKKVLKEASGPKRQQDVNQDWKKTCIMELYNLYSLAITTRLIKYRTRWAGHVARVVVEETFTQYFGGET